MALLERVATLVRANLNDLVDKAEDPEKMIKQVILDMQNQLLQVKTQVAISIADQHVLEKKLQEGEENERQWMHRAGLAIGGGGKEPGINAPSGDRAPGCLRPGGVQQYPDAKAREVAGIALDIELKLWRRLELDTFQRIRKLAETVLPHIAGRGLRRL